MMIRAVFTVRRRWRTLVTVTLTIITVRVALQLSDRIHYDTTRRHHVSTGNFVMSAGKRDELRRRRILPVTENELSLQDVDFADWHIYYPVYVPRLPLFVNVDDRRSFMTDYDNRFYVVVPPRNASRLTGHIRVISHGVVPRRHECSWKTSETEFHRRGFAEQSTTYINKTLCPLLVPDGQTFQHFVDGVLPTLVQLFTEAPRLAAAVDLFAVYRPRDAVVYQLLDRVGISRQRLMLVTAESSSSSTITTPLLKARRLVDTCATPPLHPQVWRRLRQLIQTCNIGANSNDHQNTGRKSRCLDVGSDRTLDGDDEWYVNTRVKHEYMSTSANSSTANNSLIVLLSRRWSRNGGRRLLNEDKVFDYLVGRFGRWRVARFGHGRVDISTADAVFSRAAAVVGVHGGAFYNIVLAPAGCVVVELMPLVVSPHHLPAPPRRLARTIVWRMADALGHAYWRLYAITSSQHGDVTLPIGSLQSALLSVT